MLATLIREGYDFDGGQNTLLFEYFAIKKIQKSKYLSPEMKVNHYFLFFLN